MKIKMDSLLYSRLIKAETVSVKSGKVVKINGRPVNSKNVPLCTCRCASGEFCGGCGHAGCGRR